MVRNHIMGAVSQKVMKANRLRNVFAILGIVLTTVLFTCIFTISGSWVTSIKASAMRQSGTAAHGEFKYLSYEEYEKIKQHDSIEQIGTSRIIAMVTNSEIGAHRAEVRCASDEWVADITYTKPTEGRLPEAEDEVALDSIMLGFLGVPKRIGENVTICYTLGEKTISNTFTLVGYWDGDSVMPASTVWVSKAYSDEMLKDYVPVYEGDKVGTWNAPVLFKQKNDLDKKFRTVVLDCGYSLEEIRYGVNDAGAFDSGEMDFGVVAVGILVILIITLCGYLIISNIFSISVVNDLHSYALFKVIGMTKVQLRSIVRKQVVFLCVIGIPIGVVAGYAVGYVLAPYTFRMLNASVNEVTVNPLIFIASAVFSWATVFISTHKSVKLVQQVSPVAALRSTEASLGHKSKCKKRILTSGRMKLVKMAYANVFRNKRKSINVIISLVMSMVLLNIAYSLSSNFDLNKYISNYISCDFMVAEDGYFVPNSYYTEKGVLSSKKVGEMTGIDGISQSGCVYFSELMYRDEVLNEKFQELIDGDTAEPYKKQILANTLQKESVNVHLYGIDEMLYEELGVCNGSFDKERFASGGYILVSAFDEATECYTYEPGEVVEIPDRNGNRKSYEVMAIAELPYSLSVRHSHLVTPEFILPANEYCELQGNIAPMVFAMNVEAGAEIFVENALKEYCKDAVVIDYVSRGDYKEMFDNEKQVFVVVGVVLSVILGLIGIINYMNSMITSIIVRRREFALMQSIGMSSKQLNQMLINEGLLYAVFTYLGVLTVGCVVGKMVLWVMSVQMWYLSSAFHVTASLICAPLLLLISVAVPYIGIRFMARKSVIERLGTYD